MDLWPGNIKPGVFILVVITSPEIALSLVTPGGGGFELNLVREVRVAVLHHIPPERRDFYASKQIVSQAMYCTSFLGKMIRLNDTLKLICFFCVCFRGDIFYKLIC